MIAIVDGTVEMAFRDRESACFSGFGGQPVSPAVLEASSRCTKTPRFYPENTTTPDTASGLAMAMPEFKFSRDGTCPGHGRVNAYARENKCRRRAPASSIVCQRKRYAKAYSRTQRERTRKRNARRERPRLTKVSRLGGSVFDRLGAVGL